MNCLVCGKDIAEEKVCPFCGTPQPRGAAAAAATVLAKQIDLLEQILAELEAMGRTLCEIETLLGTRDR